MVMANASGMGGKIGGYLRDALEILPLSQNLATIRSDLKLEQAVDELKRQPVDQAALREFLQHNEFNSWLQELGADESSPPPAGPLVFCE